MRFAWQPCLSFALTVIVYVTPFAGLNLTVKVTVWSAESVTRGWPADDDLVLPNTADVTPTGVPGVS